MKGKLHQGKYLTQHPVSWYVSQRLTFGMTSFVKVNVTLAQSLSGWHRDWTGWSDQHSPCVGHGRTKQWSSCTGTHDWPTGQSPRPDPSRRHGLGPHNSCGGQKGNGTERFWVNTKPTQSLRFFPKALLACYMPHRNENPTMQRLSFLSKWRREFP